MEKVVKKHQRGALLSRVADLQWHIIGNDHNELWERVADKLMNLREEFASLKCESR